jgi:DNA-binding NtrC family response regulator
MLPSRLLIIEQFPPLDLCLNDLYHSGNQPVFHRVGWDGQLKDRILESRPDLILMSVPPPSWAKSFSGWGQERPFLTPTLAVIAEGADDESIRFTSRVVDDYVFAPVRAREISHRIERLLGDGDREATTMDERLARELGLAGLVGRDPAFLRTVQKIPLAARSRSPVLIVGETGTGKELCARAIHSLSARHSHAFVPVDCAALPEHLLENELFGHVRGAFTDAGRDQKGLVALANGGTLFFDEIDSLSPGAQSKLLRFFQERTYRSLGSERFVSVDVNLIAATNSRLEDLVQSRQFRSDLFFRLNVLRLDVPPLRDRPGDIALLAGYFLDVLSAEYGVSRKTLAPATLRQLSQYQWPGNIRELYNVIQRAFVFVEGPEILPVHIPHVPAQTTPQNENFRKARTQVIEAFEKSYIEELLRRTNGNVSRAALLAQKDRRVFGRLMKRYGIRRDQL